MSDRSDRPRIETVPVILETLKLARTGVATSLHEIASGSRTTEESVRRVLSRSLGRRVEGDTVQLDQTGRFMIAMEAARAGALDEVARRLDWREFERFTEDCVEQAGFQTRRNVRIKDETRRWELDVVATKHPLMLCFDCKHWARGSPSRFRDAAEHQRNATASLIATMTPTLNDPAGQRIREIWALPVILTLFEPHQPIQDGAVLVSVNKLQDFTFHIAPYDPSLPFIRATELKVPKQASPPRSTKGRKKSIRRRDSERKLQTHQNRRIDREE